MTVIDLEVIQWSELISITQSGDCKPAIARVIDEWLKTGIARSLLTFSRVFKKRLT